METEMECPLRYLLALLGGKWKMPIVCMLAGRTPLRNATIKRRLGHITSRSGGDSWLSGPLVFS